MDTECTRESHKLKIALLRLYIKHSSNRTVFYTNHFTNFTLLTEWLLPQLSNIEFKDTSKIPPLLHTYETDNLAKILQLTKSEIIKQSIKYHLEQEL